MRKPRFAAEFYYEIDTKMCAIRRELSRPGLARSVLLDDITEDVHNNITGWRGLADIRDIAYWAGARAVGATRATAERALVEAWLRHWELNRDAVSNRKLRARAKLGRMRRKAYVEGVPLRDLLHRVRTEQAKTDAIVRAKLDPRYSNRAIRKNAKLLGNSYQQFSI